MRCIGLAGFFPSSSGQPNNDTLSAGSAGGQVSFRAPLSSGMPLHVQKFGLRFRLSANHFFERASNSS
jgi:hypothetical protein